MSKRKPKPIPKNLFETRSIATFPAFFTELRLKRDSVESYQRYPFNMPSIRTLDALPLHPKVTYFIGENGSGKSTLLEALAIKLGMNPEGGSRNFNFSTRKSHSILHSHLVLSRPSNSTRKPADSFFLRAESYFNVATEIERLDQEPSPAPKIIESYGGKSLHEQSHGESFFALMNARFRRNGIYLLDEPEAALSPSRQMTMLAILHRQISDGCQFVIATHSPIVMAYPEALIYLFSERGIQRIDYEETDHYRLTRNFLNRREQIVKYLLSDED